VALSAETSQSRSRGPRPSGRFARRIALALLVVAAALVSAGSSWAAPGDGDAPLPAGVHEHHGPNGEIDVNVCPELNDVGAATCFAHARIDANVKNLKPAQGGKASPDAFVGDDGAYGPLYLQSAYNAPSTNPGTTVAIVDAYDDSRAESDLAYYRSYFGLSPCTTDNGCFRRVDQRGGTSYPQGDRAWATEISLDLDMVSAICPNCHLLLVEADTNSSSDLGHAVNEAVALGASVVSMSWGGAEYSGETSDNAAYYEHPGVALIASSGDYGYGAEFPSAAPDVVSVGGTSLYQATKSGTRDATETVWSGTGGGCSAYMPKPSWQHDTACSRRTMNDVSAVADPNTGVWVWDTYPLGGGWGVFGGTSVSAPIIASLYALAGNATGSTTAMPSTLYGAFSNDPAGFNDVTSGFNGTCPSYLCNGAPGFDGPTGLGTPNSMTPFLLSSAAPAGPPPPTNLVAAYTQSVSLTWTAPAGATIASYVVERNGVQIAKPTGTSFTDTSVGAGTSYSYDVRSVDSTGKLSSPSNLATVTTPAVIDATAPKAPSSLRALVVGTTQVALSWVPSTDDVGVDHYDVYRDGAVVGRATLPNYLDSGLSAASSHVYKVVAVDAAGNPSSASSNASAKTASVSTSSTGTLAGVVYNSLGRPLANAVVQLTGNGITKSAKTSNTGVYKFTSLPAGQYTVTITPPVGTSAAAIGDAATVVAGQTIVDTAS
jgi:chitodextrinase